jgi:dipeptidyl aminopeptidase/acylaminoacyl peptidase
MAEYRKGYRVDPRTGLTRPEERAGLEPPKATGQDLEPPARAPLGRRLVGYVLIAAGSLCSLYIGAILFAFWALAGAEGVGYALLIWSIFAATVLGLGLLAVGIALVGEHARLSEALRSTPGVVGLSLLALVGATWAIPRLDREPYPFTDAPKGSLIAYAAPDGIRLVRANGGSSWRVPGTGSLDGPHWAPNGERFAAVDLGSSGQAYSVARDGSSKARLPATDLDTTPAWSPDGSRIAVVEEGPSIRLRPLAGGLRETFLPLDGNEPDWSPDGTQLAFQSNTGSELLRIYVVRADGSGLRPLTTEKGEASEPAWAPDGRSIAFASDLDGDEDIYVVRPDGSGLRKITHNTVDDMGPTWSPDGRRLAFGRSTSGWERTSIVVLDLATGAETELVHVHDDIVWAPDWQPKAEL